MSDLFQMQTLRLKLTFQFKIIKFSYALAKPNSCEVEVKRRETKINWQLRLIDISDFQNLN